MKYLRPVTFVTAVFVLLLPSLLSLGSDPDLWFHVRLGLDYLRLGGFPSHDIYSFGQLRSVPINLAWLSEILFAAVYNTCGRAGLLALKDGIFLLFTVVLIYLAVREYRNYGAVLFLLLFFQPFITPFFNLRTATLGFLFFVLSLLVLEMAKEKGWRCLLPLPVMMLLWTNLHGSFLPGFVLIAFRALWLSNEDASRFPLFRVAVILSSCFAVTFINPEGINLHIYAVQQLIYGQHLHVSEWSRLDIDRLPWFLIIAFIPLLLLSIGGKAENRFFFLLFLLAGFAGCFAVRLSGAFAISGFLVSCSLLKTSKLSLLFEKLNTRSALCIFCLVVAFLNVPDALKGGSRTVGFPSGDEAFYPVEAVGYLRSHFSSGNVALPFFWGGYVLWSLGPDFKVSADGRNISVYDLHYFAKTARGYRKANLPDFLASSAPAGFILIQKDSSLQSVVIRDGRWTQIYSDETAVLFQRTAA